MTNLFHGLQVGRAVPCKSMVGTDFARFPDFIEGEIRNCFLPLAWYAAPTGAYEKLMQKTSRGWIYWTSRAQLAQDIADTLHQLDTKDGSVSEIRVATLQRLITAEEWQEARDIYATVKAQQA